MAKLDRKDVKIFAENSNASLITEFRTEDEILGTASYSRDPDIIQNANYSQGWVDNINNTNTKIYGEDLNAVSYVISYLLKYLYENGIAEWKSSTTYYEHSICKVNDVLYISLQDNNTGNDPTNTVGYWRAVVLDTITNVLAGSGADIVKAISGNQITFKSLSVDGYGSLQDDGDNINIHVLGGSGIVDAFWGQIQGTLSNQTDLSNALASKQDTVSCSSPLTIDVNNEISIPKATTAISGYLDSDDFTTFNGKQDALTGFTHSYNSGDDEATIEPSATTSSIGSNSYPITNLTANNITGTSVSTNNATVNTKLEVDTIARNNGTAITVNDTLKVDSNVYTNKLIAYDASTGYIEFQANQNKYRCESGKTHDFVIGTNTIANIGYIDSNTNGLYMHGDIRPYSNETYDIGSGGFKFKNFFTKQIGDGSHYTDTAFVNTVWTTTLMAKAPNNSISVNTSLSPDSTENNRSLGNSSSKFYEGWISYIKTSQLVGMNGGTKLSLGYNHMSPETADQYQLGYQNRFLYVNSLHFDQGSDIRNKTNIKNYEESVLDKIKNITPITYNYKSEERTTLGLSAQELKEIEPLIVNTRIKETKDGKEEDLGIDLYSLSVFAIKAIKELSAKVETLEKEVAELKGLSK